MNRWELDHCNRVLALQVQRREYVDDQCREFNQCLWCAAPALGPFCLSHQAHAPELLAIISENMA